MFLLKVLSILIFPINISQSMYYLTNFHTDYPDAHVLLAKCGDTVSLPCQLEFENSSSSLAPTMWFRLYENAYPQPLILGDRQLIADQRFMLRTQNTDRHLEIVGVRKDDEGYYLCKSGNQIQYSYNLTIPTETCIDIIPNHLHGATDEPIHLVCRIHSIENGNLRVEWTRNDYPLTNHTESISNYSSTDGTLYETLVIKNATRTDTGIYACRYGEYLTATAQVIVNHYPGGSKSRRLISLLRGNSSSSKASLRTVLADIHVLRSNKMLFNTILGLVICIFVANINALETCPGPASDSQDDFRFKYDAAPIVVYGTVSNVKDNKNVALKVNCVLKGDLTLTTVDLIQSNEVANLTECHYLQSNKQYLVFLQPTKSTTQNGKTEYRLADMEEIEINKNTVTAYMNDQCSDEDDYGIEMTLFYFKNNRQCDSFTAPCNELTQTSIPALNYAPLSQATTFLGGLKKVLSIPNMSADDNGSISGKQGGAIGDEHYHSAASMTTIWMPLIAFLAGLVMIFDI